MDRRRFLQIGMASATSAVIAPRVAHSADTPEFATATGFHEKRKLVDTPFGRISYWERGAGGVALFLHGWPLNGFHWRGAMALLSDTRRCIAPDFLGLGYTQAPADADLSPVAQARMIVAFMDAMGIARADVVSNDSGTAIAQLVAVHCPERVRSLLLTNGDVHTNSPSPALKPALEAARQGVLIDMIERHLTDASFAWSPQGLGGICYGDPRHLTVEAMRVYFSPLLANAQRRRQAQQYGVAFEPNPLPSIADRLTRLPVPARMLWGTADIHFDTSWAYWLDRRLPRSRGVRLVEGAKLFFTEESPDLVAEEARVLWRTA